DRELQEPHDLERGAIDDVGVGELVDPRQLFLREVRAADEAAGPEDLPACLAFGPLLHPDLVEVADVLAAGVAADLAAVLRPEATDLACPTDHSLALDAACGVV